MNAKNGPEKVEPGKGDIVDLGPAQESARSFRLDRQREETRGRIAMWLLWLLIGVVAAAFLTVWINMWQTGAAPAEAVKTDVAEILQLVLGPVITLLGTVTGFYFGARSRKKSESEA